MFTQKPCDVAFDKKLNVLDKAVLELQGAANTCVRQAASDLRRACDAIRPEYRRYQPDLAQLAAYVEANNDPDRHENLLSACHAFVEAIRPYTTDTYSTPLDQVWVAAGALETAIEYLLRGSVDDLREVHTSTVQSRAASGSVLHQWGLTP